MRINANAPRLWLLGIAASLTVNLYKMEQNFLSRKIQLRMLMNGSIGAGHLLDREMSKLTRSALQDLIDLIIPLSIMGYINISASTVGLAGSITSVMGAMAIYPAD